MKSAIKSVAPEFLWQGLSRARRRWFPRYFRKSYSQEGEDLILERFLEDRAAGFYVDIGAHHPTRYSNTYRLYLRGWRGINVDAAPGSMAAFRRLRPRDINVEAAVSSRPESLKFYIFNDPALSTFDKDLAMRRSGSAYFIAKELAIPTRTLGDLLAEHLPPRTAVDVLTIDAEGLDYEILQSNDWERFAPEFIVVECTGALSCDQVAQEPVSQFLGRLRYSIVAKTMNSVVFRSASRSPERNKEPTGPAAAPAPS